MSTLVLRNTKGSALTFTEMDNNFSNLNSDKLEAVVSDTTPQLGGNLDVNGNSIVSTSAGNIAITPDTTGKIVLDGLSWPTADGTTGQYLKTDGAGNLSWDTVSASVAQITDVGDVDITTVADNDILAYDSTSGNWINQSASEAGITSATGNELENVVEDTTPQLGGNLDGQGNKIEDVDLDNYKETIYTGGSTTGTITPDVANGNVQKISLTGNITFNAFANAEAGQSMTLIIDTNGTSRTLTSTMLFSGGNKTLSTTDTTDIMTVFYDGTTYYASLANDFS